MIASLLELYRYRWLLWNLVLRDIRIRYKQAILGVGWAVFQPLSLMILFSFVFTRVAKINTGPIPYPVFAYTGLMAWQFFQVGMATATVSLVQNMPLVTKIYSPREVFPLSAIFSKLPDFLVALGVLLVLMVFFGIPFRTTLLWLPFVFSLQLTLMIGLGLIVAMGNLFYRDVGYVMNALLTVWMFATPVMYPLRGSGGVLSTLLKLNPMSPIISAYRDIILRGVAPSWLELSPAIFFSVVLLVTGWCWFHRLQYLFAERI